jgi:hypothetical protein
MSGIKKLSKDEYEALATAGARALLVEMKGKELSLLQAFPSLRETIEGFNKRLSGRSASRSDTATRLAWAVKQPQLRAGDLAKKFNITQGAAMQQLRIWTINRQLRRVSKGVYSGQKLLKAA